MHAGARGLTWASTWTSAGEGPYTRLAKLSLANPLPRAMLQPLLTGKYAARARPGSLLHPRTLLCDAWLAGPSGSVPCDWTRELSAATLSPVLGQWAPRLASDQVLRYCASCLAQGYQSALCQIDALTHCPVHGQALRDTCAHCEAPMPRYAWDDALHEALAPPMHCARCAQPYAPAWQDGAQLHWRAMPGAELYVELAERLGFARQASWSDARAWEECFREREPAERRRSEWAFLQRATGASLPACFASRPLLAPELLEVPVHPAEAAWSTGADAARAGALVHAQMREAYVATCRPLDLAVQTQARADASGWRGLARWGALQPATFKAPKPLAACLLRLRFERGPGLARDVGLLGMRDFRPLLATLQADFAFDRHAWLRFFASCHAAELRFAHLLCECMQGLSRGSAGWCEALGVHASGLIPQALELPLGAGLLRVHRQGHDVGVLGFAALPTARELRRRRGVAHEVAHERPEESPQRQERAPGVAGA